MLSTTKFFPQPLVAISGAGICKLLSLPVIDSNRFCQPGRLVWQPYLLYSLELIPKLLKRLQ
jgi:hypothetical protein